MAGRLPAIRLYTQSTKSLSTGVPLAALHPWTLGRCDSPDIWSRSPWRWHNSRTSATKDVRSRTGLSLSATKVTKHVWRRKGRKRGELSEKCEEIGPSPSNPRRGPTSQEFVAARVCGCRMTRASGGQNGNPGLRTADQVVRKSRCTDATSTVAIRATAKRFSAAFPIVHAEIPARRIRCCLTLSSGSFLPPSLRSPWPAAPSGRLSSRMRPPPL